MTTYAITHFRFFLSLVKAATTPSTSAAAVKRDEGSHELANTASARQHWIIQRNEILNKAFKDDNERTLQESTAQNQSSKVFVLKPFQVVELSNDESYIKVRLKLQLD